MKKSLGDIATGELHFLRDIRVDRDAIRCVVEVDVDGSPIRLEFVEEEQFAYGKILETLCGLPVLSRADMFTAKLLANTHRYTDSSTFLRDAIDLAVMIHHWGPDPAGLMDTGRRYLRCVCPHRF